MSDYNDGILLRPCLRMDTRFGDEYESVEFGDGTGYVKAAPILAKVGALHEEIDRLRDESAKLRKLVRDMAAVICVYDQRVDDFPPALPMFTDKMRELGIEVDV